LNLPKLFLPYFKDKPKARAAFSFSFFTLISRNYFSIIMKKKVPLLLDIVVIIPLPEIDFTAF
jgi:hypothetical protein